MMFFLHHPPPPSPDIHPARNALWDQSIFGISRNPCIWQTPSLIEERVQTGRRNFC